MSLESRHSPQEPAALHLPQSLSPEIGRALPRVRLRLWLESGKELYFGLSRAQLLLAVDRLGLPAQGRGQPRHVLPGGLGQAPAE